LIIAGLALLLALDWIGWRLWRFLVSAAVRLRGGAGRGFARRAHPILQLIAERFPRLFAVVFARTRADRFVGLPLTLMVAAALYLAFLLAGVVDEVTEAQEVIAFDEAAAAATGFLREEPWVDFFLWITRFGDTATLVVATIVAAGFLWADRRPAYVWPLWLAVLGSQATTWLGKFGFGRGRPEFVTAETAVSPAFPSAHATGAAAVYGFIAYAIARDQLTPRQRFEVTFWALVMIALVGFSRIVLGVHFASDVVAGYLVGGFWLLVAMTLAEYLRQRA